MKKVLVAYFSATGKTEKMAEYIAEGVRFSGQGAVVKKIGDIKDAAELAGYDGYIFGSPTYSLDVPEPVKAYLLMAQGADLAGFHQPMSQNWRGRHRVELWTYSTG